MIETYNPQNAILITLSFNALQDIQGGLKKKMSILFPLYVNNFSIFDKVICGESIYI